MGGVGVEWAWFSHPAEVRNGSGGHIRSTLIVKDCNAKTMGSIVAVVYTQVSIMIKVDEKIMKLY